MTCYIGIAVYIVNIVGWKLLHKTKRVGAKQMDLETDRRVYEEVEEEAMLTNASEKPGFMAKVKGLRRRI